MSAFVIHFSESIIYKLAIREMSIFYLVHVAEETGFECHFFGNPRQVFLRRGPLYI